MGLLPTLQRAAWGGAQGPCTPGGRPRTVGGTLTPRSALPGKATGHCRGAPREAPRPLGQRWSAAASSLTRPPLCSLRCGRGPRACPQVGRWGPQAGSSRLPGRRGVCFQPSAPLLGPVHPPPAAPLRGRRHLPGDHGPPAAAPSSHRTWACFSARSPAHQAPGAVCTSFLPFQGPWPWVRRPPGPVR